VATFYFLAVVAVCAIGIVWLLSRSWKKREESSSRHAAHHAQPLYQHRTAGHALLHSHTGRPPADNRDIWHTRRPRATEERWEQTGSLTARRIRSDEDTQTDEPAESEMTMSVIEYTPEEVRPEEVRRPAGTKKR
jgi:hypothetical protein